MKKKVVLILSGGMDSTTLLVDLVDRNFDVSCISFDYGQKHAKELNCSEKICDIFGVDLNIVELPIGLLSSALTQDNSGDIPEGHYADDNMKATVVPNRNMIMLSIAAGFAISRGINTIAYGAHSGDHTIYPDCRPAFRDAMQNILNLCHFTPVELMTPYMNLTKSDICAIGRELAVPYQFTWTCYVGGEEPCGKCGSCVERAEAFEDAGISDPLVKS